ncbi:MAG TPA: sulfotransferase [Solirubrobacteraceae bacterium]|nr:sulfotransferase [Solirubrobacteraceae bacterium]
MAAPMESKVDIRPIFIFSIQRSGSTLVQRIIGAHQGVATVSEPWILLPYLYTLRPQGVVAEYPHPLMVTAVEDFCRELPAGSEDYYRELHDFVIRLYRKAAGAEARFFLDKTPNYNLIPGEIMRLFPEGRFVFLWRNPLSILTSIVETWQGGHWHPTAFREDLFIGLPRLVSAYRENRDRAHSVRFEDLVGGDDQRWRSLMEYLEIEFDPDALQRFTEVKLNGRLGDPTGVKHYSELSTEPTEKWKRTIGNPVRREWSRRYLRFLGNDRLAAMGYDGEQLIRELSSGGPAMRSLVSDLGWLVSDIAREPLRVGMRRYGIGGPSVIGELLKASR